MQAWAHDYVVRDARAALPSVKDVWRKKRRIDPFVMMWPRKKVEWLGMKTNQTVGFGLPKDRSAWTKFLAEQALQHSAFALLLVEQREDEVVAILESPAGAISWHLPIKCHGDARLLGDPVERTDAESIGLLYDATS